MSADVVDAAIRFGSLVCVFLVVWIWARPRRS